MVAPGLASRHRAHIDEPMAVDTSPREMNDAHEMTDSGWHIDPVAGTVTGSLPRCSSRRGASSRCKSTRRASG
ncbi:hypothetical protein BCEN4_2470005 [Burkholderia cenocepacia]|nr:hypothetical protein BCEN4_2470005 [Burkholderia cenocepacia]